MECTNHASNTHTPLHPRVVPHYSRFKSETPSTLIDKSRECSLLSTKLVVLVYHHHSIKNSYQQKSSSHRSFTTKQSSVHSTQTNNPPQRLPNTQHLHHHSQSVPACHHHHHPPPLSRKIHSHPPPLPQTPRHKHNARNNQRASNHTPDHNARNLLWIKRRPALDLEPIRQSRKRSPVAERQAALLAGWAGVEPERVSSVIRKKDVLLEGSGLGGRLRLIARYNFLKTYPLFFKAGTFQIMPWEPAVVLTAWVVISRTGSQPPSTLECWCTRRKVLITCWGLSKI